MTGLALVGALFTLPSFASAGVVVKSTGPSAGEYPVGRQVADSSTITLRAGDKITVLTDSGTSVMQGPGSFRVGEGATRTRARFSNLSRRSAAARARTGATRTAPGELGEDGFEVPTNPPSLWFVNLATEGTVCLYDLNRVRLWRAVTADPQTYTIQDQSTQDSFEVNFVETETMRAWDPAALPLLAGRNYAVTGPASAGEGDEPSTTVTTVINFATLEGNFRQQDELASALIANGCTAQLTQLADELEAYAEAQAN
ncbi:MAG: hypothetical protein AAF697_09970 [Pseudomonadota bacterium]